MEKNRYRIKVPGIHCAGCIRAVETALSRVEGVEKVRVDYLRKEVHVVGEALLAELLAALDRVGYPGEAV
ncbi:hypothetical protein FJNA_02390 [Thermus sp. FJN-A]